MSVNRGKDFEKVIKEAFEKVPGVSIDRLHDQMNGFAGSANISDFIMYKYPHEYYIECKSVHGNTLPFSNISKNQWNGMVEKSKIPGVFAGVMCWWIDRDVTVFLPIDFLVEQRDVLGRKSVQYGYAECEFESNITVPIIGKKKKVFFEYNMEQFFKVMELEYKREHINDMPKRSDVWQK